MIETVHAVSDDGRTCSRCYVQVCGPNYEYEPEERVVVPDGDPQASWRTLRRVSCGQAVQERRAS